MARLRFKKTTPPGLWRYIQPDTKARIDAENYEALMKKVLAHRAYKNLPRASRLEIEEDVERQICSRLSLAECSPESPEEKLRPITESQLIGIGTVLKFSKSAMDWLASGAKVVDLEHMKRRQAVCLDCVFNRPIKSCSCSSFYKLINKLVPENRRHPDLHTCTACLCHLSAKTQMPIDMIEQADEGRDIQYDPLCWVTQEKAEAKPAVH